MGISGPIANVAKVVAIRSGSKSRELSARQYRFGMTVDKISDITLGLGTDRGTIVEQVRRKQGAWTVEDLSAFLDVSPKLLYKLVKTGKLNAYRIGTLIRIDGQDAASYLTAHATIPQKPQPAKRR
jgi:excisionase family DNA binding protein